MSDDFNPNEFDPSKFVPVDFEAEEASHSLIPPDPQPKPVQPVENTRKAFKVTISDEDYLAPDELDEMRANIEPAIPSFNNKPAFEVHIDDENDEYKEIEDAQLQYKGEIYFSNVKPVKPAIQQNTGAQRASDKANAKKQKSSVGSLVWYLAVLVILTLGVSLLGISCINDIIPLSRKDETVTVTVEPDSSTSEIIDLLSDNGLIKQKWFCKIFYSLETTLKNRNKTNVEEPVYLSGRYDLNKQDGFEAYLSKFKDTQIGKETTLVSIPEGLTCYQIFERLDKFGVCKKQKLISSLTGTKFEYTFFKAIPDNKSRTLKLEGYLYPNTYEFYVDSDPNSVIRKLLEESEKMWSDEYQEQADKLGYSMDEILTIASIIQREAANKDQMKDISSVIHNRLSHPASWPTLGCDSTETYIKTYVSPNVGPTEAAIYMQKYNTYNNQGLPPGPICNPGDDAINAALYPNETNYYFFRHDKHGKIYLARTQAEHDANANEVLRANSK